MPKLTDALRSEYQQLFDTCQIRPERAAEIDAAATKVIAGRLDRLERTGHPVQVGVVQRVGLSRRRTGHQRQNRSSS